MKIIPEFGDILNRLSESLFKVIIKSSNHIGRIRSHYLQYHFRCVIPNDLRNRFHQREIRISLKNSQYSHSKKISYELYNLSQSIFSKVRQGIMSDVTLEDVKNILRQKVRQTLRYIHQLRRNKQVLTHT